MKRKSTQNSKRLILGALVLCLLGVAPDETTAQRPGPPGTFRIQVTLIPVDVRVTDAQGRPVLDLKKEDFTLLENGIRQDIRHFDLQTLKPEPPESDSKVLLRRIPTMELAPEKERTFLILLGRGRLQRPFKNIDAATEFVRSGLLPQDRVAVFAYNRATDFTTNHEQIAQVLERYKNIHEKIESRLELRMSGLAAIYGSKEIPKSLQPDIDKIFQAQGAPGSRQLPPGRVTDSGKIAEDTRQATDTLQSMEIGSLNVSPFDQLRANAVTDLPFEEYISTNVLAMQDLQNIYTSIEYLRYVSGEKHLLFFTENGLFLPRLDNDRSIAAMANDARVTIDTFQTGGVYSDFPMPAASGTFSKRPPSASRMFALSTLKTISELTGGQSFVHEDIGKSLSQLNDATLSDYLLGYYPKNTNWNGNYRRITVKVNRPGLNVSFRHGYYARDTIEPFDREAFLTYSRISSAASYSSEVKDVKFKAKAKQDTSNGEIKIDLIIDPTVVPFQAAGKLHQGKLFVTIFYGNSKGRYLGDVWDTMEMNLREETYQRVMRDGIPFSVRIPMKEPGETFKIVVYNYENDKVGSVMLKAKQ
jgi:VWFA-related protein